VGPSKIELLLLCYVVMNKSMLGSSFPNSVLFHILLCNCHDNTTPPSMNNYLPQHHEKQLLRVALGSVSKAALTLSFLNKKRIQFSS